MSKLGLDSNGQVAQIITQGAVQNFAYDAHVESNALGDNTTMVRLCATTDCYVLITKAGTAATSANGALLPAGTVEFWQVGKNHKISVIKVTTAGILSITEAAG